jgi:antitoxin VapB
MNLNIKDPRASKLAQALADKTGETLTLAVIHALQERLDRVQSDQRTALAGELVAIGRRCAKGLRGATTAHGDLLYDERGWPV